MEATSTAYQCSDGSQVGKMQCQLNSYYDAEYVLRSIVYVMTKRVGMDDRKSNRVALAVDELYANIAKHGYGGKPGRVEFDAKIHREGDGSKTLHFVFRDYAVHVSAEKLKKLVSGHVKQDVSPGGCGLAVIANYNSNNQFAISGEIKAVEKAIELAREEGARKALILQVSGAFHSPLMAETADELMRYIKRFIHGKLDIPWIANVSGEKVEYKDLVLELSRLPLSGIL